MKRKRRTEECKRYLKTVEFLGGPFSGRIAEAERRWEEHEREKQEFFAKCRDELGYEEAWGDAVASLIEKEAWDIGHSNGFTEVKLHIERLMDFLAASLKSRTGARRNDIKGSKRKT